jgi:hypothetical protein
MEMEIVEEAKKALELKSSCCGSDTWFVDPVDLD